MNVVAVTGGTGFIGRHVVALLERHGAKVRILTRQGGTVPEAEMIAGDVTDPLAIRRLLQGAHAVIHLAGVAHTALRTAKEQEEAWRINVEGPRVLLEQSDQAGVRRVLLTSSAHVYREHRGYEIGEDAPTGNDDFYSRTKEAMEKLAVNGRRKTEVVVVRPCLTYGPGVRFNLERLMRAVDRGYYFHLSGQDPKRSFLSVNNVAAAIVHLLEAGSDGQIYNIADEHPESLVAFVNRLAQFMNRRSPRTMPYGLARAAAWTLTPLARLGIKMPMHREALAKLTDTFTISTKKLAATKFIWPDSGELAFREMVEFYQGKQQGLRD
ncbi:MAG TPA: NAD-dependent epimerase/dehydratase family protein [Candidatus Angelobacter sp.]|nr:NAD-dependent epimerase/dehydratase family protein [Candidatus Angelobacter sp.]